MISKQSMEDKVRREKKRDKKKEYECETSCFRSFLLLCCTDNNIHRWTFKTFGFLREPKIQYARITCWNWWNHFVLGYCLLHERPVWPSASLTENGMSWAVSNSDSAVFNYFLIFEDKMFAVKLTNTIWILVSVIQNIRFSRFNAPYVYWCQCKDFLPHCFKARFVLVTLKLIHDKHFKFLSTFFIQIICGISGTELTTLI